MTPVFLPFIADKYVGDPQEGVKEILKYYPEGTQAKMAHTEISRSWVLNIVLPDGTIANSAAYTELEARASTTQAQFDTEKTRSIHAFLTALVDGAREFLGPGPLPGAAAHLKTVLQKARSAPELAAAPRPSAGTKSLVAKVLARKLQGLPSPEPAAFMGPSLTLADIDSARSKLRCRHPADRICYWCTGPLDYELRNPHLRALYTGPIRVEYKPLDAWPRTTYEAQGS